MTPKTISGVEVFITIMPNGKAYVPFAYKGVGVAFAFDHLPELIAHLQEMVSEGPAIIEQLRMAHAMGEAAGGVN